MLAASISKQDLAKSKAQLLAASIIFSIPQGPRRGEPYAKVIPCHMQGYTWQEVTHVS